MADEQTQATPTASDTVSKSGRAYFMADLAQRVLRMDFLDLTYRGGLDYKHGVDGEGQPVLIQHEGEHMGAMVQSTVMNLGQPSVDGAFIDRYTRRRRMAAYENQYRPIVDKFSAYITQTAPKRSDAVQKVLPRLKLDTFVRDMVEGGLKLTEAWLGWDAAKLPTDENLTRADAKQADPQNQGQAYLVARDPQCVVDFDEDDSRQVTRVVFEEVHTTKGSLTAPATSVTKFREWTGTEWILYEAVTKKMVGDGVETLEPTLVSSYATPIEVREEDRGTHSFGKCPWVRFRPKFPSEDLAELCRALFNTSSLLDEEVYKNTFTQKYATGIRPEDLVDAATGPGNWMAFPESTVKVGVLGSIEGQAQVLMARMEQLRESIFSIVSLDHTKAVKQAAESAEKRKMDLENLYSALVKIVEEVERCENLVLTGMGLASEDKTESLSRYDRKFDVNTLQDLLDQLKSVASVPFVPATFRRRMAEMVMAKLDPFGDAEEYGDDVENTIDVTVATAQALDSLKTSGCLTGELAATVLGVPEDELDDFLAAFDAHPAGQASAFGPDGATPELDANGDPIPPEDTTDAGEPTDAAVPEEPSPAPPGKRPAQRRGAAAT